MSAKNVIPHFALSATKVQKANELFQSPENFPHFRSAAPIFNRFSNFRVFLVVSPVRARTLETLNSGSEGGESD